MLRGTSHAVNHLFNSTFAEDRLEIKSLALTAENVTLKAYEVSKSNTQHTAYYMHNVLYLVAKRFVVFLSLSL